MSETGLDELLSFIAGRGPYAWLGGGITSYPRAHEENQRKIHAGCLELEAQGKISRHLDTPDSIVWKALPTYRS